MNIPKTLNELTPASYNPRIITEKSFNGLKASIGEFGDLSGIVFNLATGNLVAGHQRVNALKADGAGLNILIDNDRHYIEHKGERFYVRFVNWDIKKERLANVTANNPKIQGQWSDNIGVVLDEIVVDASPLLVDLQIPDLCQMMGIGAESVDGEQENEHVSGLATMKIVFASPEQLQAAENDISELLDRKYSGATYKIKTGES